MPLRASTQSIADAYAAILRQAADSRFYLVAKKVEFQQPQCSAAVALAVIQHCGAVLARMAVFAATPGLATYAKAQTDDPAYDIAAEYVTFRDALAALKDDLVARFPKDANGYLLYQTIQADGSIQNRNFTAAQLAPVLPLTDAAINSVS